MTLPWSTPPAMWIPAISTSAPSPCLPRTSSSLEIPTAGSPVGVAYMVVAPRLTTYRSFRLKCGLIPNVETKCTTGGTGMCASERRAGVPVMAIAAVLWCASMVISGSWWVWHPSCMDPVQHIIHPYIARCRTSETGSGITQACNNVYRIKC